MELTEELKQFTGTEHYYKDYLGILLTDGIKYLMERAKCCWLISDIAVIVKMKLKKEEFVVITLTVKDHKAKAVYEDGNNKVLFFHNYEYTDFPIKEIKLYYSNGVLLLPNEY